MTLYEQNVIADVGGLLENCTQKEKLQVATWIVLSCMKETQPGMTEGFHRLDVVTRHCGDIMTHARGILGRYGNSGKVSK